MTHDPAPAMVLRRLPSSWRADEQIGRFAATALPAGEERVDVVVRPAEAANPDYLLERYGATEQRALDRPQVQSLPDLLADGVSIVSFPESSTGSLHARIAVVRRAWNLDIAIVARNVAIENADALFSAMFDLMWEIRPEGTL